MANPDMCKKFRKMLVSQAKRAFGVNLPEDLQQRGNALWLIGLDEKTKTYVDICDEMSAADLAAVQGSGYQNADAGYLVNAHRALGIANPTLDIFFINLAHLSAAPDFIEPIVVHELAHLREQSGVVPAPKFNDAANAEAILVSLYPNVRDEAALRHNRDWALHLAIGARTILQKRLTQHRSIRAYLEAAVPSYDRIDGIKATKGWP